MFLGVVACTSETAKRLPHPRSLQGVRHLLGHDQLDEIVVQEGRKEVKVAHLWVMVGLGSGLHVHFSIRPCHF